MRDVFVQARSLLVARLSLDRLTALAMASARPGFDAGSFEALDGGVDVKRNGHECHFTRRALNAASEGS